MGSGRFTGGLTGLAEIVQQREQAEERLIERLKAGESQRGIANSEGLSRRQVKRISESSMRPACTVLLHCAAGPPATFREQILTCLAAREKKTAEIIDAVDGHPVSIKKELKRLLDAGEIVKVRHGVYVRAKSDKARTTLK